MYGSKSPSTKGVTSKSYSKASTPASRQLGMPGPKSQHSHTQKGIAKPTYKKSGG